MNPSDESSEPVAPASVGPTVPPVPTRATASAAARPSYEAALEQVAFSLLRERRNEQRWRVFFRLAWLGIVLAVLWAVDRWVERD